MSTKLLPIIACVSGLSIVACSNGSNIPSSNSSNSQSKFVLAGEYGAINSLSDNKLQDSIRPKSAYMQVSSGNGTISVVGVNGITLTSTDGGTSWISHPANESGNLLGVAYGNNKFVSVGVNNFKGLILSSTNAKDWNMVLKASQNVLSGVGYFNQNYVAVGMGGSILFSADGSSWIAHNLSQNISLNSVSSDNNGKYIVVGVAGHIYSSTDKTTWVQESTPVAESANSLMGIAYGNSVFVAIGQNGAILTSNGDGSW